jgi:hypothetical protein
MVAKISVGIDVAIESHGLDVEFFAEFEPSGVAMGHGGLRHSDLSLGGISAMHHRNRQLS